MLPLRLVLRVTLEFLIRVDAFPLAPTKLFEVCDDDPLIDCLVVKICTLLLELD